MRIEELASIIGMQLFDRKGEPRDHLSEGPFHGLLASSQEHHTLTGVPWPHRSTARYSHTLLLNFLPHDAPNRSRSVRDRACPRECVPWARLWSPDWLAAARCVATALCACGSCATAAAPSPH